MIIELKKRLLNISVVYLAACLLAAGCMSPATPKPSASPTASPTQTPSPSTTPTSITRPVLTPTSITWPVLTPENPVSSGATYYVAPDGKDSNVGSESSPWRTIGRAAREVKAGDRVLVREGVYGETVYLEAAGSPGRPIVFSAYPGEHVVLEGKADMEGILSGEWQRSVYAIYSADVSQWELGRLFMDGEELPRVSELSEMQRGSWYVDERNSVLYVWSTNDTRPDAHRIELTLGYGFLLNGAGYVTIRGFEIRGYHVDGVALWHSPHNTVIKNVIHHNGASGIEVDYQESEYNLVQQNVTYSNGLDRGGSSGISVWEAGPGNVVRMNVTYNNRQPDELYADGNGIIVDRSFESGALVENNLAFGNDGSGVTVTDSSNVVVRNNTCVGNGQGELSEENRCGIMVVSIEESVTGNTIVNNVTVDNYLCELGITGGADNDTHHIDYNNWYRSDGSPTVMWDGNLWKQGRFSARTGYEEHGLSVDPLFVSPDGGDYRLMPESGVIDAGDVSNAPPNDLDGKPRPMGGGVDMGAYEFGEP